MKTRSGIKCYLVFAHSSYVDFENMIKVLELDKFVKVEKPNKKESKRKFYIRININYITVRDFAHEVKLYSLWNCDLIDDTLHFYY